MRSRAFFVLAGLAAGCGGADHGPEPASPEPDSGAPESPAVDESDSGAPASLENHGFDTARPLDFDKPDGAIDGIGSADERDYFAFDGTEGEWVELSTLVGSGALPGDTSVTLFGPDRNQLAYNDTATRVAGDPGVDARVIARLPRDGTYSVMVEDEHTPPEVFDASTLGGGAFFTYRLRARVLERGMAGVAIHDEAGVDTAATGTSFSESTGPEDTTVIHAFLVGGFDRANDTDAFQFVVDGDEVRALTIDVLAQGRDGNGSTSTAGRVWITDAAGAIVARIDQATGQDYLGPPLDPGEYLLWLTHPESGEGDNDFYALSAHLQPENPLEEEDDTNGNLETAEPLARIDRDAYVLSHLPEGDVDYFAFDSEMGGEVSVFCGSSSGGSGLVDLHVDVRGADDAALDSAIESPTDLLALEHVTLPGPGTYFVRLQSGGQLPDVAGDWARCGVFGVQ